mmetsp:Transcript_5805/g.8665  ORF Transcript_5805/g.8665 Transcript_5805/m.8665 type:complete len:123 (+) Transcript_5805:474-842(+)
MDADDYLSLREGASPRDGVGLRYLVSVPSRNRMTVLTWLEGLDHMAPTKEQRANLPVVLGLLPLLLTIAGVFVMVRSLQKRQKAHRRMADECPLPIVDPGKKFVDPGKKAKKKNMDSAKAVD